MRSAPVSPEDFARLLAIADAQGIYPFVEADDPDATDKPMQWFVDPIARVEYRAPIVPQVKA